ncbi:MAG: formate dehydrogenase accessory protein FdhE [Aeropyrum sp.]|nr:formate dehydrogenase accessory protein FdhE [Aeropyrum sp.]MCE4616832.1 formate dehydrogenase accessory protein FdhE [Aeropyrum sp.]
MDPIVRSQRVRKRVAELATAISAYKSLHMLDLPDIGRIKELERLQGEIIEEIKHIADPESCDLDCFVVKALQELGDSLEEYCQKAARLIGGRSDSCEQGSVISTLRDGSLDPESHAPLLVVLQAVLRAYSESLEERGIVWSGITHLCPVCGVPSETMVKRRGAEYYMVCHMCFYQWRIARGVPVCPRCGATSPLDVGIITDKSRRIGLAHCQRCGYVWRAILDEHMKIPPTAAPLIALGAERFRPALEEARNVSGMDGGEEGFKEENS